MERPEQAVAALDRYYLWRKPRPGFTLFGAYVGRLLLTNRRLAFLSTGTNGVGRALIFGGAPSTDDLDLSALGNRGSLSLRLEAIDHTSIARRIDFSWYLIVKASQTFTFMSKLGFDREALAQFQEALEIERARVQSDQRS